MAVTPASQLSESERSDLEVTLSRFLRGVLLLLAIVLAVPTIAGLIGGPSGSTYLGEPYNTDDHMVYAAWMHQGAQGHLLMDNRFAVDSQPGLTVNLYFFGVGQLSRLVGIPIASNLARIFFGLLFAYLLYKFVRRFDTSVFMCKLAVVLGIVGGGLGFLVWHDFGRALVLDRTLWMKQMTLGSLPTDVWQPEGFVFPSLLTNGLFAVSLCLILLSLGAIVDARRAESGWGPVVTGFLSLGLLMNIHSYDVLLVGLISLGLLFASFGSKQASWAWAGKVFLILLGILPGALWFIHILQNDPVFAARAATPTYAANFRAMIYGYLPLLVLGTWGVIQRNRGTSDYAKRWVGVALYAAVFVTLTLTASPDEGFQISGPVWLGLLAITLGSLYCLADSEISYNLVLSWALIGLLAPYFPGLFQRKLAMGLEIPWALLSAFAVSRAVVEKDRGSRNLAAALVLLVLGGSSIRWMLREIQLIRTDVSETTVQPVYLKPQIKGIVDYLNRRSEKRCVVLCIPGSPSPVIDESNVKVLDQYQSPALPDLNPILTGLAGVYTYAGHWSETPDYAARRNKLMHSFFSSHATNEERLSVLNETGANYVVAPVPEAFPAETGFADLSGLGRVVFKGSTFELIQIRDPYR